MTSRNRSASTPLDSTAGQLWGPEALSADREAARTWQARYARKRDRWVESNPYYYKNIERLLRFVIEPHKRVLSVRCETGNLLAAVDPKRGLGVDLTDNIVEIAREKYSHLEFRVADPEDLQLREQFDYILVQNISDFVDVQRALEGFLPACHAHTRLVIYTYNHLYQPILQLAEKVGLKMPVKEPNWLSELHLRQLLELSGFEPLKTFRTVMCPYFIPPISSFLNRVVGRVPGLDRLCLAKVLVARPRGEPRDPSRVSVSVVIPCKNERDNVAAAVARIPEMGRHTQIVFCDDQSTDGTAEAVEDTQRQYPERDIVLIPGPGICKAKNVWTGFDAADGDVLMILDADLTVMPEELPYFFSALVSGKGELINGSRMVYPMQKEAMRFFNMVGNKCFSLAFRYVLEYPITDTLCGTKVLWRRDWDRVRAMVGTWGPEDRWGDFDLLFGATKLNLRIVDQPVHYQERIHGMTKMVRVFSNGLRMLRVWLAAVWRFKMVY